MDADERKRNFSLGGLGMRSAPSGFGKGGRRASAAAGLRFSAQNNMETPTTKTPAHLRREDTAPLVLGPATEEGLTPAEIRKCPPYSVSVYGMRTRGVVREGKIYYAADPLFDVLRLESPQAMIACWPEELAIVVDDVPDCTFLLSRAGCLRLIAHGQSPKAMQILESVADGLVQFFTAESMVQMAEAARRDDLRLEKDLRKKKEAEQLAIMEKDRVAKKAMRASRRAKSSQSPQVNLKESLEQPIGTGETKSFRTLIRQSLSVHNAEIQAKQEVHGALRQSRLQAVQAEIEDLPDHEARPDPEEAVVELGASYLQNDSSRVMANVVAPTEVVLTMEQVFSGKDGTPAMGLLSRHFAREGRIDQSAARKILTQCADVLREEPNCLEIEAPCNIFGDVHGQFWDLIQLIRKAGHPLDTKQLWLGDYIDRGAFGCEVTLLLAAAKIKWPKQIFLLRGNHETRAMAEKYNFMKEAVTKYPTAVDDFFKCFDTLPLAAVIHSAHGNFFCVHGGLSEGLRSAWDINNRLERFEEPEMYGPTTNLLWSDPLDESHMDSLGEPWTTESFQETYFGELLFF